MSYSELKTFDGKKPKILVVGSLAIRACLRLVHNGKFRFFAYYCFIVGIIALVANFA